MSRLQAPPPTLLDAQGAPNFGASAGVLDAVDWTALKRPRAPGWFDRRLRHKRWQYLALAHPQVFVGLAVVDLGWAAHGFAYAFRRGEGRPVSVARDGLPAACRVSSRPFGDADARLPGLRLNFMRSGDTLAVRLRSRVLSLEAALDLAHMAPPACVIAPANLLAHCTHKSAAIDVTGSLEIGGDRLVLDGACASLDHSDGLLAHDTRWNWASAHASGFGFNLQAGYMGDAENIVWLEGQPYKLGPVHFDYNAADPLAPWRIRSACGNTDLRFAPEGLHRGNKNLGLVASRFVQAIGCFSGRIGAPGTATLEIRELLGVTEDHASRW
ncbi:DUF2804 domain-containing protein [Niveibacterium umoris]|uniref:DUF2804 domain-containing protein n=1 Tax=Niveibacterium umoris TaxID=1193620 RepID=A0A840BSF0_9RHOO|nr:hypothetical protein [Niveibacterium umoris]